VELSCLSKQDFEEHCKNIYNSWRPDGENREQPVDRK
jgi:hypothetical protein